MHCVQQMNRRGSFTLFALVAVLLLAGGCGIPGLTGLMGSRTLVTQEYDFNDFTAVETGGAFSVSIAQGDEYSVAVTVNENILPYLRVEQQGGTLTIGLENLWNYGNVTLEAEITMPELRRIHLSGASNGTVTGFASNENFSANLSGASSLAGDIAAGDVDLEGSGAAKIELTGSGENLRLNLSGASNAELGDFPVQDADVEASGASNALINPAGRLNANASGASSVHYLGSPELGTLRESGGSSIGPQ